MPSATLSPQRRPAPPPQGSGGRVEAVAVNQHAGKRRLLHDVSVTIEPGTLVAIIGGSGAGKTTLLEVLAGVRAPSSGQVTHDGVAAAAASGVGYVPQDDIIHVEMPLQRTLQYAARLRLPAGTSAAEADRVVDETLRDLDLVDRADVPVRQLSGGQRKRASIAVELLTRPGVFLLDEPTSGLDPATAAEVVTVLRRLAQQGVTVVLTTHEPASVNRCDHVIVLARDGHLAFSGSPDQAVRYFEVNDVAEIYDRLAREPEPRVWADRFTGHELRLGHLCAVEPDDPPFLETPAITDHAGTAAITPARSGPTRALREWWLLTRRNAEVLIRNRLTLAILLGSPVLVTAMMATLFRPGAFDPGGQSGLGPVQTVFWIAFAGFFFGLTYGLLQIVGELPVFRRERFAGVGVGSYTASKIAVLLPVLAGVSAMLLGTLRALDRLPGLGWNVYAVMLGTVTIAAVSALTLGLLASASVANASQAALALPMLCFPQVLFAGAVVPLADMAAPGRVISEALTNRHAFEALGRTLELDRSDGTTSAIAAYGDAFSGDVISSWLVLAGLAVLFGLATVVVLHRRTHRRGQRQRPHEPSPRANRQPERR